MTRLFPALLFFAVAACASAEDPKKDPAKEKESSFRKLSLDKALEAAKKEKKVVFIDFTASWCGPCKKLDAETFSDDKVKGLLKEKLIAIKVDVDDEKELARKYKISSIPAMVFVDGEGKEVGRLVGFRSAAPFLTSAEDILKKK